MFVWNENEEIRKRKEREKSEKRKKPVSRARTESRNRKGEIEIRRIELLRQGMKYGVDRQGMLEDWDWIQKGIIDFGILENAMKTQ